jgi:ACS family hexuronate transporter-like MFS transporter
MRFPLRWLAIGVFVLSSTLNYLDRQLLSALAPTIMSEFHLSNLQYGEIFSVFSFVYALMAPLAGLFLDHAGLNLGMSLSVIAWSCASAATGLTHSFPALLGCRVGLGVAEAAGIPGTGKANGMYLESRELAFGTAINQIGISVGMFMAPLLVAALAPRYGWRFVFVACGAMGLLWVPLWWFTSRAIPARPAVVSKHTLTAGELLRDRRLWGLMFATVFLMALYTLWSNWTTVYFVHEWHLTQEEANRRFAWIPPIFATLGGFFGAILAFYWIRRGVPVLAARMRVFWITGVIVLATAAIPVMPSPALATAVISLSFFLCLSSSTNLYALPIDLFGPGRAAFGVSALTFAYGLMSALFSPAIGAIVDHVGFPAVCITGAVLPLAGAWILRVSLFQ